MLKYNTAPQKKRRSNIQVQTILSLIIQSMQAVFLYRTTSLCVDSLFVYLMGGEHLEVLHVPPGQLPALLRQVLKRGVLTRAGWNTKGNTFPGEESHNRNESQVVFFISSLLLCIEMHNLDIPFSDIILPPTKTRNEWSFNHNDL